jgi:pimeloyl-ACP methyl ester carboxylesterase
LSFSSQGLQEEQNYIEQLRDENSFGDDAWLMSVDYPGSGTWDSVSTIISMGFCGLTSDSVALLMWGVVEDAMGENTTVPIHLIGLSFGGMVATKMAALFPTRIHSLCLCNTYAGLALSEWQIPFCITGLIWLVFCYIILWCQPNSATSDLNEAWVRWGAPGWRLSPHDWERAKSLLATYTRKNRFHHDRCSSGSKPSIKCLAHLKQWALRRVGDISFVAAVLLHHVSEEELQQLQLVKFKLVVVSTEDWLVLKHNSTTLKKLLSCEIIELLGHGHLVQIESPKCFNKIASGLIMSAKQGA